MSNIDELNEKTQAVDEVVEIPQTFGLADESEYEAEPEVIEETEVEEVVEVEAVKKKKFPLQGSIIVALCLVVGALITYLALALMIPTTEGTWLYETEDGLKIYYTLEEREDDEYYFEIAYGSAFYPGTYQLNPEGTESTLVFNALYNDMLAMQGQTLFENCLNGTYTYSISGNKLFGECSMTLNNGSETPVVVKYVEKPEFTDYVKPYENFKVNKSILGSWELDNSMFGLDPTVFVFNEDGTMTIDNSGFYTVKYMYSPVDNKIKMAAYSNKIEEMEVEFELKDGNLIFDGIMLKRPGAAADNTKPSVATADQNK